MDSPTETGLEISDDSREWLENSLEEEEEVSSGLDRSASSPVTPESERRINVALSFGNGSSDVSPNHESESSYSELDSEAEAFYSSLNHQLVFSSGTMDSEKPMSYSELMKKLGQYEEELRTKSLKLQDSELEIEKLKGEAEKRESPENLRAEVEAARREIERKDTDIENEKRRALELERQVVDLESQLSDLRFNVRNVVDELHASKVGLAAADAEISKLEEMLCTEKTKLEKQTFLDDQIKHYDAENMEMKAKEVKLEAEINALKTDLASRDERMEALNKDLDKHKLRYDMLMAEKDGVCAEVDNLKAEMRTRDIQIEQMEEQLNQLVSESGNAKNTVEELRAMVKELEKQAELQGNAISEGEEEKREAIRQLCYSLDHYKTGYRQLLRFLSGNKKQQQQATTVV
ncbi:protein NETWORKED 4B [Raphanus sativus]|uniref:Protein NETWORKED 4B n=1 Tax=Raphanus sativus TaxID=3726 RepID=A0A6J0MW61_RAPSA|nr:protein NETWORKED 4B [Raphanus sativus]